MNVDQTISELSSLSLNDRLRVVQAIWDTLPEDADLTVTSAQQAELDRRIAAHDADPSTAVSHEEMMRRLKDRT